jgi:hypothetical protein
MGSGISHTNNMTSKGLVCPKDYDKENYQKILLLFDKLDSDGDMMINEEELLVLTTHHIKNKLRELNKEKLIIENVKNQKLFSLKLNYDNDLRNLEREYVNKEGEIIRSGEEGKKDIENKLVNISNLTRKEKYGLFKSKFTDKDDKLSFDLFFKYMRTRTCDIKNINWKTEGKLDYLFENHKLSVKIDSPNNKARLVVSP